MLSISQLPLCQLVLLLLSYHRHLGMISEALELCMEGGRVSQSWCMCAASHGYGGLGQGWRWRVVCMWDKARGWSHAGDTGALPMCEVIH